MYAGTARFALALRSSAGGGEEERGAAAAAAAARRSTARQRREAEGGARAASNTKRSSSKKKKKKKKKSRKGNAASESKGGETPRAPSRGWGQRGGGDGAGAGDAALSSLSVQSLPATLVRPPQTARARPSTAAPVPSARVAALRPASAGGAFTVSRRPKPGCGAAAAADGGIRILPASPPPPPPRARSPETPHPREPAAPKPRIRRELVVGSVSPPTPACSTMVVLAPDRGEEPSESPLPPPPPREPVHEREEEASEHETTRRESERQVFDRDAIASELTEWLDSLRERNILPEAEETGVSEQAPPVPPLLEAPPTHLHNGDGDDNAATAAAEAAEGSSETPLLELEPVPTGPVPGEGYVPEGNDVEGLREIDLKLTGLAARSVTPEGVDRAGAILPQRHYEGLASAAVAWPAPTSAAAAAPLKRAAAACTPEAVRALARSLRARAGGGSLEASAEDAARVRELLSSLLPAARSARPFAETSLAAAPAARDGGAAARYRGLRDQWRREEEAARAELEGLEAAREAELAEARARSREQTEAILRAAEESAVAALSSHSIS